MPCGSGYAFTLKMSGGSDLCPQLVCDAVHQRCCTSRSQNEGESRESTSTAHKDKGELQVSERFVWTAAFVISLRLQLSGGCFKHFNTAYSDIKNKVKSLLNHETRLKISNSMLTRRSGNLKADEKY